MSAIKNISLFVPHIFPNFDQTYVADVFSQFGNVDRVDFVAKEDRNGKPFNSAYIHFEFWNDKTESHMLQTNILDGKAESRVYHDGPWYWIVLENKGKKHVAGDRKPRIDLGNGAKSISVSSITPAKPILKRGVPIDGLCPGAPVKKSYAQVVDPTTGWSDLQRKFTEDMDLDVVGPNDYPDFLLDCFADEIFDQMNELEDELESEDAVLVTIDGRYIRTIEEENLALRNEINHLKKELDDLAESGRRFCAQLWNGY